MNYLLDTNACIALIRGTPASVRTRFQAAVSTGGTVYVSSVAAFELGYGVAKSARPALNGQRVKTFFSGPVTPLPFDHQDAEVAGAIRAQLESVGKPVGAYDLLIAGQARRRDFTLVTANVREFARIDGLTWQDWSKQA